MMYDCSRSLIKKYLIMATERGQLDAWFAYLSLNSINVEPIGDNSLYLYMLNIGASTLNRFIPQIKCIFKDHIYRERYAIWLDIVTPVPLSPANQLAIENKMMQRFKVQKIYTLTSVLNSLIGGITIDVHDHIINASLKNEIQQVIRNRISATII